MTAPIIDLKPICGKPDSLITEADWNNVSEQVRKVFSKYGYCYLINHGVPEDIVERVRILFILNFAFYNKLIDMFRS
jgi:isopenicillin N synthase-like dioxygenase